MTARTGKLLELYGAEVLATAVAEVLARGLHDPDDRTGLLIEAVQLVLARDDEVFTEQPDPGDVLLLRGTDQMPP